MSRRALSFTSTKLNISPLKDSNTHSSTKYSKLSETRVISPPVTSFVTALQLKLKERYNTVALAMKKLGESFLCEMTLSQFRIFLKDLKFKYTEKDLKEFLKLYGSRSSSAVTVPIKSLKRSLKQLKNAKPLRTKTPKAKNSFIKTHNFSAKSTPKVLNSSLSTLNRSNVSKQIPSLKPVDSQVFLDHLVDLFSSIEQLTDFFFLYRPSVSLEEFSESLASLSLIQAYPEYTSIFFELSEKKSHLHREDFYKKIYKKQCLFTVDQREILNEIRCELKKNFKDSSKAFEEVSKNGTVNFGLLSDLTKKFGLCLEKNEFVRCFKGEEGFMKYNEFKSFWIDKEKCCSVRSCELDPSLSSIYCQKHLRSFLSKGDEVFNKLHMSLTQKEVFSFVQEVIACKYLAGVCIGGLELKKKDVFALKEFLSYNGFTKKRESQSVKYRTKHNH